MRNIKLSITILVFSIVLMACVGKNQNANESGVTNVQIEPNEEGNTLDTNLDLTREEKIRTIELTEEYFFQERRVKEDINSSRPLSDDALVYLLEKYYIVKENWEDYLLPGSGEIKYKAIKEIGNQLLQTYVKPSVEPEKVMVGYQNNKLKIAGAGLYKPDYTAYWYAFYSFPEGDDYGLWIDAITGELLSLTRYPMDWFDGKKNVGAFQISQKGDFTEEDILKATSDYLENLGLTVERMELASVSNSEDILLSSLKYSEEIKIPTRRVYAYSLDGKSVNFRFLMDDLTIQEIFIR